MNDGQHINCKRTIGYYTEGGVEHKVGRSVNRSIGASVFSRLHDTFSDGTLGIPHLG